MRRTSSFTSWSSCSGVISFGEIKDQAESNRGKTCSNELKRPYVHTSKNSSAVIIKRPEQYQHSDHQHSNSSNVGLLRGAATRRATDHNAMLSHR